jgi:methyl-accepting chemotaxis protein
MNEFDEIEELRQEVRALAGLIQHWLKRTEVNNQYLYPSLDWREDAEFVKNNAIYLALVETNQKIKKLAVLSQDISSMAALISTLESRLNLLAINAAIEATKLGESGLKLVIIADEVRHLANSFANYLKKIEEFVPQIQGDISQVMVATEEGIKEAIAFQDFNYFVLEEKVDFLDLKIIDIQEYSQDISEIVNWIYKNVDKMNVLALNARAEAARFGEAGKGFAIIADDVTILAKKSSRSLKEIEAIAQQIHREISHTFQAKDRLIEHLRNPVF